MFNPEDVLVPHPSFEEVMLIRDESQRDSVFSSEKFLESTEL